MKTIELNNEKYVLKSEYDSLSKKKEKTNYDPKDYMISDGSMILAIIPLIKNSEESPEALWKANALGHKYYREVSQSKISSNGIDSEVYTISQTRFAREYINQAKSCANVIWDEELKIFLPWDKNESRFVEDNPCILVFDKLCFVLAPRIEVDE